MERLSNLLMAFLFITNISCAQLGETYVREDKTIVSPDEINYDLELVHEKDGIIWAIEFFEDNSILATIKSGELIHFKNGEEIYIKGLPDIYLRGQGGLMDIEFHPNFNENKLLYMSYAFEKEEGKGGSTNIARAELVNDSLINFQVLYEATEGSTKGQHFGGRLEFDDKGFLYFSIGDRGNRDVNPQNLKLDGGKIYRINEDGTIPDDNPFIDVDDAKKTIFSYGHRNPQGMFKHPITGEIWTNEHGPKGGDEINIIQKGLNYGWPEITYGINYSGTTITKNKSLPNMEQPLYYWIPSIAPSCFEYITSNRYEDWQGSLLAGALKFKYLERIVLEKNKVVYREKIAEDLGRPRDVKESKDGYIYVSIENKGIYKIVPKL